MKIKKSVIKKIDGIKVGKIVYVSDAKFKFTKEETRLAMRSALRLRKRASKKFNCSFNEISMALCLKEAYRRIAQEKLEIILSKENKHAVKDMVKTEFGFNNIDTMVREANIYEITPQNIQQNIVLNLAKLEMKTRIVEV